VPGSEKGPYPSVTDYLLSFIVGIGVGLFYALIRVKSPAPPLVALVGLLGIVIGEQLLPLITEKVLPWLSMLLRHW
jgi:XapX domain-containing protein